MNQTANMMPNIINALNSIEHTTVRFTKGVFFGTYPSLQLPDFTHPELSMLRSVSWFYVMYHELGKPSIKFVIDKLDIYELDGDRKCRQHPVNVQKLRTLFQHNLDPSSKSDQDTRIYCDKWFHCACQSYYPKNEDDWITSLGCLLKEAIDFLITVDNCIRSMENDESATPIVSQWIFRRQRYHPQYEFDRLIEIIAQDLGRPHLDARKFSNRHYSSWTKELEVMENYNFETYARRQIERAILEETRLQLPIDGRDIMQEFQIGPGVEVGDLLKLAMRIHDRNPCSRDELIEQLKKERQH